MDIENLRAAQNWERAIIHAIGEASHFIALLSRSSVNKRGFVQREMKHALDVLQLFPPDEVFVVPVRLDDTVPRDARMSQLHWVDLFPSYDDGLRRLVDSLGLPPLMVSDKPRIASHRTYNISYVASPPHLQLHRLPLNLLSYTFVGLALSLFYGISASGILYLASGLSAAVQFFKLYIDVFGTFVSLGLITAIAFITGRYGSLIPASIERAFTLGDLLSTEYYRQKLRFLSIRRTVAFAAEVGIFGFVISSIAHYPLRGLSEVFMIFAAFTQWALTAYVTRKLFYALSMLQSVIPAKGDGEIFRGRRLDMVNAIIRLLTTAGVIYIYFLLRGYMHAPYVYNSAVGSSARVLLLLPPAALSLAFLVLNFIPPEILRQIYRQSADAIIAEAGIPLHAKVALERGFSDDLRRISRLTLTDLPIMIMAGITLLQFFG
jgi:hypothetical protein